MYGLLNRDFHYISEAVERFPEIEQVLLFGSRAMGNYKKGSDVDLAVVGKDIPESTISRLNDYLNEIYPLPYMFDLVHYDTLTNENLKEQISKHGKEIWNRQDKVLK